jgi:hypothetical protein
MVKDFFRLGGWIVGVFLGVVLACYYDKALVGVFAVIGVAIPTELIIYCGEKLKQRQFIQVLINKHQKLAERHKLKRDIKNFGAQGVEIINEFVQKAFNSQQEKIITHKELYLQALKDVTVRHCESGIFAYRINFLNLLKEELKNIEAVNKIEDYPQIIMDRVIGVMKKLDLSKSKLLPSLEDQFLLQEGMIIDNLNHSLKINTEELNKLIVEKLKETISDDQHQKMLLTINRRVDEKIQQINF